MKVTLKKEWRSPRGKLYPSGSMFIKNDIWVEPGMGSTWYDFIIPGESYGFVLIPDNIFKKLTPEEISIRRERKRLVDDHIKATSDPFLKK